MKTLITRRKRFNASKINFEAISFKSGEVWFNCLYIIFFKEDFPALEYPRLIDGFREGEKRFEYYDSSLAKMDWHGGITFYQETINPEHGKTTVKAGCDYQHLYDDHYMRSDNGELILMNESERLLAEFLKLAGKDPHH